MTTSTGHTSYIRATRVIGTDVCSPSGSKIGKVEDVVLDKLDNSIAFAVVGFGGILGMGEKFHPIPWASLDYVPEKQAYVVPFSEDTLKDAPSDTIAELTGEHVMSVRDNAYDYYGVPGYWI